MTRSEIFVNVKHNLRCLPIVVVATLMKLHLLCLLCLCSFIALD